MFWVKLRYFRIITVNFICEYLKFLAMKKFKHFCKLNLIKTTTLNAMYLSYNNNIFKCLQEPTEF